MKAGRPTDMSLAKAPCSEVVVALINGEQPNATVNERRMAARLLTEYGVDRSAIAFLLGVNPKTITRYTRAESA